MLKNITFSADEKIIAGARQLAAMKGTTLNAVVRTWLESYVQEKLQEEGKRRVAAFEEIQKEFEKLGFAMGEKMTREEMNARR